MKDHLDELQSRIRAQDEAYAQLEAEHHVLRDHSGAIIDELQERVEALQQSCEEFESERVLLLKQLSELQGETAVLEATKRRVQELESAITGLHARSKRLLADLEKDRAAEEARADGLAAQLGETREALVAQAEQRAAHEDAALRLAVERQGLAAALELERLINAPLRHTRYATSTTLAHVMRSPVAPTVQQHSAPPRPLNAVTPQQDYPPVSQQGLLTVSRPGTAPAPSRAAAAGGGTVFELGYPDYAGTLSGRDLTRLARSWATTSTTAGPPHPAYLDNLSSHLTPPPPGPPRTPRTGQSTGSAQRRTGGAAGSPPAYSPSYRPSPISPTVTAARPGSATGVGSRAVGSGSKAGSTVPSSGGRIPARAPVGSPANAGTKEQAAESSPTSRTQPYIPKSPPYKYGASSLTHSGRAAAAAHVMKAEREWAGVGVGSPSDLQATLKYGMA